MTAVWHTLSTAAAYLLVVLGAIWVLLSLAICAAVAAGCVRGRRDDWERWAREMNDTDRHERDRHV